MAKLQQKQSCLLKYQTVLSRAKPHLRFTVFLAAQFLIVEKDFCLEVILLSPRTLCKIFQAAYMKFPVNIF